MMWNRVRAWSSPGEAETVLENGRLVVYLNGYKEGMSIAEQLMLGIELQHEAHRDGENTEGKGVQPTHQAPPTKAGVCGKQPLRGCLRKLLWQALRACQRYWAMEYTRGIVEGQDYIDLPSVIVINILDFGLLPLDEFHTSFHIWEDTHKDFMLTDALEMHFIDMVKWRKLDKRLRCLSPEFAT
jgi:hypothetical protein